MVSWGFVSERRVLWPYPGGKELGYDHGTFLASYFQTKPLEDPCFSNHSVLWLLWLLWLLCTLVVNPGLSVDVSSEMLWKITTGARQFFTKGKLRFSDANPRGSVRTDGRIVCDVM